MSFLFIFVVLNDEDVQIEDKDASRRKADKDDVTSFIDVPQKIAKKDELDKQEK